MIERAIVALAHRRSPEAAVDFDEIANDIAADMLSSDEEEREGDDRRHLPPVTGRGAFPDLVPLTFAADQLGMEEDHFVAYGEYIQEEAAMYRKALARRDTTIIEPEVGRYLTKNGMKPPEDPKKRRELYLKTLQAAVSTFDKIAQRQRGGLVENTLPSAEQLGPRLSEAFGLWQTGGDAKGARKPSQNTIVEAENIVRRFKEWHGDWRLGVITKAHAREFRDALARMPSSMPDKLRKLPLRGLLKKDLSKLRPRSATTVNKQLTILAAIVSNAQREGLLDGLPSFVNPFDKDVKLRIDQREIEEREPFDVADLRAIFKTPVFSEGKRPKGGAGEAAFWLPLIGLFSGMRLSEIAGLLIRDLQFNEEIGRWLFDVRPNTERTIKNASSMRRVPMHRELERIGLLRYRESLLAKGSKPDDPLWPDVSSEEKSEDRASTPWSKWFNRYLRTKAGITSSQKVFHSFRHTFKRMARSAEISEELHDALTGHSGAGRVGRTYGRGYAFDTFVAAMDRILVPEHAELSALRWCPGQIASQAS